MLLNSIVRLSVARQLLPTSSIISRAQSDSTVLEKAASHDEAKLQHSAGTSVLNYTL